MKVIVAEALGICFGVRDALQAMAEIPDPDQVTIYGELVHNEQVLVQLNARGFQRLDEAHRQVVPESPAVLITAHGVSNREREKLQTAGKRLIDTTCPLVSRAHDAAQALQAAGYHVLVLGRRGHVEVIGLVGDLDSFDIVERVEDVREYPHSRLGIVCQTTSTSRDVARLREAIAARNPQAEIRFVDTVCHPTKDRQDALESLLPQVDAVVVVGGRNSNNTKQLAERCRERGVTAHHIQTASDLRADWFAGCATVGLTAGTSTLDETIEEVRDVLESIASDTESVLRRDVGITTAVSPHLVGAGTSSTARSPSPETDADSSDTRPPGT